MVNALLAESKLCLGGISLKSLLLRKITYSPGYVNENTCSQNWRNYIGYLFLCVYPFLDMEYIIAAVLNQAPNFETKQTLSHAAW